MGKRPLAVVAVALVLILAGVGAYVALAGGEPEEEPPEPAADGDAEDPTDDPDDEATDEPDDGDEGDEGDEPDEPLDGEDEPRDDEPADGPDDADEEEHPEPELAVESVVEGLSEPWGLAFLPDEPDRLLVTERAGSLALVDTAAGELDRIEGVPEVHTGGQGGLLDVAAHPDFADTPWVYLTYSAADDTGATSTHLVRGQLDTDQLTLDDVEVLFAAEPFVDSTQHYGSRVIFDPDGQLYMTIGDRGNKDFDDHPSQDPSNTLGTTIRLDPDGTVPDDNPFTDTDDIADEIYTYGHRNVQGMTIHPDTGDIWQSEHGEEDGDEINRLSPGGNHGWPTTHTGCHYGTDTPLGDHPGDHDDITDPVHTWECNTGGFPPAGTMFYTGDEFPTWHGDLLLGGLASQHLAHFSERDGELTEHDPLLADQGWRIRDLATHPDTGHIYLAIDDDPTDLIRLSNDADD
ncbi:PQQ-dependent sugar dehydrogenase [Egibacter rhizosphaerae]|uniref:PQQ-dependent sugar dehydrogenase n=1 Tax=Egibacter rhizosphaerae TaxID=1670831 RepID=A0A411YEA4_9ACTN|nr:PQQ-dependent sugar dehydrogenase [Egibacter rhizosphaerae]QBI19584.1 PQQ-dependent sugar dehydrogenase [Egibacter rhizosphaerae]